MHCFKEFRKKKEKKQCMYYNDYFDDAGSENEEKVIEELGSPAKLAENDPCRDKWQYR